MEKKRNIFFRFFRYIYLSYIPNRRDSILQILTKILLLICLVALIVSSTYVVNYFLTAEKQDELINKSRDIWYSDSNEQEDASEGDLISAAERALLKENPDFKGWIRLNNTKIDNPIYQAENNMYYLDHNQKGEKSVYGALYFDCKNRITEEVTDKNLVIYGHEMRNGSMFGNLKKLKNLEFYKQNPVIQFSSLYRKAAWYDYKIFAVFVLNASKKDDNGYIYNIYRSKFSNEAEFEKWSSEAYERSVINTNVDVKLGDNIITLVTCSSDFKNSRLVVMAREVREGESYIVDTSQATVNKNPLYPARWYKERGIKKK